MTARTISRPVSLLGIDARQEQRTVLFSPADDGGWQSDVVAAARSGHGKCWYARRLHLDGDNLRLETQVLSRAGQIETWLDAIPPARRALIDNESDLEASTAAHRQAEEFLANAAAARNNPQSSERQRDIEERLYLGQAAENEWRAFELAPLDKPRTRGTLMMSALHIWRRAGAESKVAMLIRQLDRDDRLDEMARNQLAELHTEMAAEWEQREAQNKARIEAELAAAVERDPQLLAAMERAVVSRPRRVAFISDIHANLPALEAVIAAAGEVDAWWHAGDVVGYGPHPNEVVARLRELGAIGVSGNHDSGVLNHSMERDFNNIAAAALRWTRDNLSRESIVWLQTLPETLEIGDFTVVHGSPRDPVWEYVTSGSVATDALRDISTRHLLNGHTHKPANWEWPTGGNWARFRGGLEQTVALAGARHILNAGSVGQPRDGDPRASLLILDLAAGTVEFKRVPYDIESTDRDIRAAGLPVRLAERLWEGH